MTESTRTSRAFVSPHTPIDLTNCDREPIHIPGAIQPHGILLGVRESDRCIVQASANATSWLERSDSVVGSTVSAVLGPSANDSIWKAVGKNDGRITVAIDVGEKSFDATLHRSDGLTIIELEPLSDTSRFAPDAFRDIIRDTLSSIERATTMKDLAGEIAGQMRQLTGFDRVWVYRFHEDWHGEIIGESMREGIEPWLGLHYPASDIPAQARALFLKNWLRVIPDIGFKPVPLEPVDNPETGEPLDLGNSVLRSVSPIHIQYLTNMGVKASLVISLIHRGVLWGLISGHHYSGPKQVSLATRTLCEFLAQALSLQVGMAEKVEDRERALETRTVEARLRERLAENDGYQRSLTQGTPTLLDLTHATGASVCDVDDCTCVGKTPPMHDIGKLVAWLKNQDTDVFHTTMLSKHYPPAEEWKSYASGLLAVALSPKRPHYILWFRPELKQTIRWAGDPNKPASMSDGDVSRLSPRGSFALWEEERRGISAEWEPVEIQAAADLRRTLLDLLLKKAEEIAIMNAELETANENLAETVIELETQTEELIRQREYRESALESERIAREEAERANRAKADFLAMMSHELRTPLNAIGGYAQMLEMGVRGPVSDAQTSDLQRIQVSQRHLLGLINNILNFAKLEAGQVPFEMMDFNVNASIAELESLVLPQLKARNITLEIPQRQADYVVRADPEKVRQILLNLLSNAIKFTSDGGRVTITTRREGDRIVIDVADTGRGIPEDRLSSIFEPFVQVDRYVGARSSEGIGLGLAISRDLARHMKGELSATSEVGKGSTFKLELPASNAK